MKSDTSDPMAAAAPRPPHWLVLIGAIVLATQEAEQIAKMVVSYCSASTGSADEVRRHWERLGGQSFGQTIGAFKKAARLDDRFEQQLNDMVRRRNAVVHDFARTYGDRIAAGEEDAVVVDLRSLLHEVGAFRAMMQRIGLAIAEAQRDLVFASTPEYDEFAALCAELRRQAGPAAPSSTFFVTEDE
jgi:hypothetical protein